MIPIQPVGMSNPSFGFQNSAVELLLAEYFLAGDGDLILDTLRFALCV